MTQDPPEERELKLTPADPRLLEMLGRTDRLGSMRVAARHAEAQRNGFFDTPQRDLAAARIGFRRRTVAGQALAVWTIKGPATRLRGVSTRTEIELWLSPDLAPAQALQALRMAARERGAPELAARLDGALAAGAQPAAAPFLETATDRTIVDLEDGETRVELALDRMRIPGHRYADVEIEAELKRGPVTALDAIRAAIEALGEVHESAGSKLGRAAAHVADCQCGLAN